LTPSTAKSITEAPALRREVAEVRRTGVAYDEGEFNIEVRCVAVPVRDFTGQIAGALGISGPIWRQAGRGQQAKVKSLQAAAGRLSAAFGARSRAGMFAAP
jgi:DNA-binding IclR family transcriptional regulator